MRLIRRFGKLFTLLGILSVAAWGTGCNGDPGAEYDPDTTPPGEEAPVGIPGGEGEDPAVDNEPAGSAIEDDDFSFFDDEAGSAADGDFDFFFDDGADEAGSATGGDVD